MAGPWRFDGWHVRAGENLTFAWLDERHANPYAWNANANMLYLEVSASTLNRTDTHTARATRMLTPARVRAHAALTYAHCTHVSPHSV